MELPEDGGVRYWGIPQVVEWLKQNGMGHYSVDFQDNYIDGELLLQLTREKLKDLNVHHVHCGQIYEAIENYIYYNPENDYEFGLEDADDFENDEDGNREDSLPGDYEPPDDYPSRRNPPQVQHHSYPPNPPLSDDEYAASEPDQDYEEPDQPGVSEVTPALPPRPPKGNKLRAVPVPPPKETHNGNSFSQQSSRGEHLTSIPTTCAPAPPAPHNHGSTQSWERGKRPAAPLPVISTTPLVPDDEALGDNYDTEPAPAPAIHHPAHRLQPPQIYPDDQENYEEVTNASDSPPAPFTPPRPFGGGASPNPHPLPGRPLHQRPGMGASSPPRVNYPVEVKPASGRPGGRTKQQYPLVIPPNKGSKYQISSNSEDTNTKTNLTVRKKVILSYTDHSLPPHVTERATPPLPIPSFAGRENAMLAEPPTANSPATTPAFKHTNQFHQNSSPSSADPEEVTDTSGLSIVERMAKISGKLSGSPTGSRPAIPSNKPDMLKEIMKKQKERNACDRNINPVDSAIGKSADKTPSWKTKSTAAGSDSQPNTPPSWKAQLKPVGGGSQTNTPPSWKKSPTQADGGTPPSWKDSSTPTSVNSGGRKTENSFPNKHSNAPLPQLPVTPRQRENQRSPIPSGPSGRQTPPTGRRAATPIPKVKTNHASGPPPVPDTLRPPRRGSIDSEASGSSRGMEEDRGLYSYHWYNSDIDRKESMRRLEMKRLDGSFIVRKSARDVSKPYTLDVYYSNNFFHIPLRQRSDGEYSMGTFKPDETHWRTVSELVAHFQHNNLALTKPLPSGQTIKASTVLTRN